jgi:hypothetical protein
LFGQGKAPDRRRADDLALMQEQPVPTMTIEEFTIQLEALVIKAQAAGISPEQAMAVLKGVLDTLSDGRVLHAELPGGLN